MALICKIIDYNSPEYKAEIELRERILRQPLGLKFSEVDLEGEKTHIHIGAFEDEQLVGCLLLVERDSNTLKMRQVAVETDLQGQGIGGKMVSFAEFYAIENGYCRIELHARHNAVQFYLDLGYTGIGDPFIEVTIPHLKMIKDWCAVIGH